MGSVSNICVYGQLSCMLEMSEISLAMAFKVKLKEMLSNIDKTMKSCNFENARIL